MRQLHASDIFAGIQQRVLVTLIGPVQLPALYRDGSMLVVGYRIRRAIAESALDGLPLEPLPVLGSALVLIVAGEYRDTSIGPYNEIGILICARRKGTAPSLWRVMRDVRVAEDVGCYVTNLPVNSDLARIGGVELFGFPKYAAAITTSFYPDGVRVTLENEFVLTQSRGFGLELDGMPIVTYTMLNNHLIRTIVEIGHRVRFGGAHSVQLKITGDGPTARTAKSLGLNTTRATFAFRTDAMKAVLPLGTDLGALPARVQAAA
jgi:hypothetical protein